MNEPLDWQDLRLFVSIARRAGLAAVARGTGLSAPTLGRRMTRLEAALERRLFERGRRGYALTADGEALLARVQDMERAAADVEAWRSRDTVRPRVRISAGPWTMHALSGGIAQWCPSRSPFAPELVERHERLDLSRREIDIGIRAGRPTEAWLAGRRLGTVEYAVYRAIGLGDTGALGWVDAEGREARLARTDGRAAFGTDEVAFTVSRLPLGLPIVRRGLALMAIPTFVGDHEVRLERTGAPIAELAHEQWLVAHQDRRHDPAVRAAIDAIGHWLETLHAGGDRVDGVQE